MGASDSTPDPDLPALREAAGALSFPLATARTADRLPRALRPRAKLSARGPGCLSLGELLVLLLGSGRRREATERVAERLLHTHGLRGLARFDPRAWRAIEGVGEIAAARLCACFEIGRRAFGGRAEPERPRLSRPLHVYRQLKRLALAKKEHLVGLYLDAQNGLLHRETISIGTLNTTRTHPREILYPAISHLALGFILAHNHPSGCLEPSPEDVEFTASVRRAGELMGIELYDHLIVGRRGYTSLRERGLL